MDKLLDLARKHQAAARARRATPSSAFSISTSPYHDRFSRVAKPSKKKVVAEVQEPIKETIRLPRSEREATWVFMSQNPTKVTTSVFSTIIGHPGFGDRGIENALPGGVPLVDHVAAFLSTAPDWMEVKPFIESLRSNRLPTRMMRTAGKS